MTRPRGYVLDAPALLALINEEPGADAVESALDLEATCISVVQIAEAVAVLVRKGFPDDEIRQIRDSLMLSEVPLSGNIALAAGLLHRVTHSLGLSLGDRIRLALAAHLQLPAMTSDRAWADPQVGIAVQLIR
ncbi:type II toxin-antitoxin system VapC family toxin [Acidithiobacillus sp.]